MSRQELAERLCLDKSTVSRLVRGLEDDGLVSRTREDDNRRVVRLSITAAGRRLHQEIGGQLHERQDAVLAGIRDDERDALRLGLTALLPELRR